MQNRELWQLELADCIRTVDQLETYLPINNRDKIVEVVSNMRLSITPHQRSLIDFSDPNDPLLLMSVPQQQELFVSPNELLDPIGDEKDSPVPFLTHRYKNRALIYATFSCSAYCRFCFRKFKTGQATPGPTPKDQTRIFEYFSNHPETEEAILSGGDPFTLTDDQLETWISGLNQIESVKRIRIHTRTLVNLPSRITDSLLQTLSKTNKPITIVTHFNHHREIAPENIEAISKLTGSGIQIKNQNVLLRGVNDNAETLILVFKKLLQINVTPYYMHQLDLARGTNHFRVPLEKGMAIMAELQSIANDTPLPRYMLDLPGGAGKIEITPESIKKHDDHWITTSPFGDAVRYNEPQTHDKNVN